MAWMCIDKGAFKVGFTSVVRLSRMHTKNPRHLTIQVLADAARSLAPCGQATYIHKARKLQLLYRPREFCRYLWVEQPQLHGGQS